MHLEPWEQSPLKSEERGREGQKKGIDSLETVCSWTPLPFTLWIREPREQIQVVYGYLCLPVFISTPNHLTTPFTSPYTPLQPRNWKLQRGERRERRKRKQFPAQPQPHAQCSQQIGKLAETAQREPCEQHTGLSLEKAATVRRLKVK